MKYREVMLDGGEHRGKTFDLKGVKRLDVTASVFTRCVFTGLRGYVCLASGKYIDCLFENCRLSELYLGECRLTRCRFINVQIRKFMSLGSTDIVDCEFSGSIDDGIIRSMPVTAVKESGKQSRRITGNDFSNCVIRESIFRSGIDLSKQCFAQSPNDFLIFDGPRFLLQAKSGFDSVVLRAAVFLMQRIAFVLDSGEQAHVYLPLQNFEEDVPKRHRAAVLALLRECAIKTGQPRVAKKARART